MVIFRINLTILFFCTSIFLLFSSRKGLKIEKFLFCLTLSYSSLRRPAHLCEVQAKDFFHCKNGSNAWKKIKRHAVEQEGAILPPPVVVKNRAVAPALGLRNERKKKQYQPNGSTNSQDYAVSGLSDVSQNDFEDFLPSEHSLESKSNQVPACNQVDNDSTIPDTLTSSEDGEEEESRKSEEEKEEITNKQDEESEEIENQDEKNKSDQDVDELLKKSYDIFSFHGGSTEEKKQERDQKIDGQRNQCPVREVIFLSFQE